MVRGGKANTQVLVRRDALARGCSYTDELLFQSCRPMQVAGSGLSASRALKNCKLLESVSGGIVTQ